MERLTTSSNVRIIDRDDDHSSIVRAESAEQHRNQQVQQEVI